MKQVFLSTTTEFKEIDTLEPGTWINLVNPTQNESLEIANAFDIDIAFPSRRRCRHPARGPADRGQGGRDAVQPVPHPRRPAGRHGARAGDEVDR